jgi:hypothetical protein
LFTERRGEQGQAAISLVLMMSLVLISGVAFAVDFSNLWFHRQSAIAAADASCQAGAMDMAAEAAGLTLTKTGFTPGTAGNCVGSPSATMCSYAGFNGYNGAGLTANKESNAVAWTFPTSVSGVTGSGSTTYPFLQVTVTENVPMHFMFAMTGNKVEQLVATSTCGLAEALSAAPMMVLSPTASGAFTYSGGGSLTIVGGPQRAVQVNSSSTTGVNWAASATVNTTAGGPNQTGSDMAVVGGPTTNPTNGSSYGFSGGATGSWKSGVLPVSDPYGSVGAPASVKSITPVTGTGGTWVKYQQDGCPDHSGSTGNPNDACIEYGPGYYPSGITPTNNYSTVIFLPGIYYLNGTLTASGSNTLRMATPCTPTCGPKSSTTGQQTDGLMFYFLTGSFNVSGCSGCSSSGVNNVASTSLTCDGSAPSSSLGMASTLSGNVLVAQCAVDGTYWDAGGDTTDSHGSPGVRGILMYQAHTDTTQPTFSGSGSLVFSGALYFHSTSYGDVLNISGGASTGDVCAGGDCGG